MSKQCTRLITLRDDFFAIDHLPKWQVFGDARKNLDMFGYGRLVFEHDQNLSLKISYIHF